MNVRAAIPLLLAGCTHAVDDSAQGVDPYAETLWADIADWSTWSHPDGWSDEPVPSVPHGDVYVVAYMDDALLAWDRTGSAPEGATAVKENRVDGGDTLDAVTAFRKRAGYAPDDGDWYWAKYAPDGEVLDAGHVEMCSTCHAFSTTDYVYFGPPGSND